MKKIEVKKDKSFKIQLFTVCCVVGITVFLGVGYFFSDLALASDAVDEVTLTVPNSCSIAASGDTMHSVTMKAGLVRNAESLEGAISKSTITAFCNSNEGYAVYAIGYSGDDEGETSMIATNPLMSNYNIATGSADTGEVSNWGMKVIVGSGANAPVINTTATGGSFASYRAVPETYTKVVSRNSWTSAADAMTGATFETAYQVYLASSQPAGSYSGKVKYVVVNPSTACPEGYEMKDGVCTKILTLSEISTMQEMTSEVCADTPTPLASAGASTPQYQLMDTRDNKLYWVAKLADGNCWMTQNLDLNLDSTKTYTPADTDIATNWTPSASTYTTDDSTWGWSYTTPESYDPGDVCWDGELNMNWDGTLDSAAKSCETEEEKHYHIGNYYNWTAAVGMDDSSSYTTRNQNVDQSICPAGWMLPISGEDTGDGSFYNLVSQYGWNDDSYTMEDGIQLWEAPLSFVLGGGWGGDSEGVGSYGGYWSSVVDGSGGAFGLFFYSDGYVYPQDYYDRVSGFGVRCVARP